ncbi:hypothetical protein K466DRAFT_587487 [Polyporus arcularius HHB13444]|uniref:Phytanoyl-CoA dioxygenase n=1 Tax=Polyporus arcularius HHB13444 TaxID=1314778 RepID=A0A5C3PC11_9APHY|nr:hypothetical protein K466DRAFT_587487 [Polyporus arcularius HHB13444]
MLPSRRQLYEQQGYVVVPNLVTEEHLAELEPACARTIAKTRAGEWTLRRTVGRQFPPYGDDDPDSWGVQHLMHPDLGESAFARWYTSDALVDVVKELLGCEEEQLQMELFNLLINPSAHSFALRWHRDDVRETASEDQELEALGVWHHGVQWNTALRKDSCLYVVPGSHKFPRTPEQRAQSCTLDPPKDPMDMPGAVQVTLQPGETVFYNNNILHCATYDNREERITLHACMGEVRGGPSRARNILQHGLKWMKEDRFRDTLDERGKRMLERIVKLQESVHGDVGYSLANL